MSWANGSQVWKNVVARRLSPVRAALRIWQVSLPTFGVPIPSKYMKGLDSLLATVQMPKGIPVSTLAIGEAGAANAALAVIAMLAINNSELKDKLIEFRAKQSEKVRKATLPELD